MADLRTPSERAYDATSLFLSPDPWVPIHAITDDPTNNGCEIPILRSRDQAHREERLLDILETIAAMDELAKSEAFGYAMGVFDALQAKGRPAA
jgi:hypothetical protein